MELEKQTIEFSYGEFGSIGRMQINLYPFLLGSDRGMGRVKKLLKIIHTVRNINPSIDTIIEQIQSFIEQFNEEYENRQKKNTNMIISLEGKVKLSEKMLNADRKNRDRVKHFAGKGIINPAWQQLNDVVKERNEEYKSLKKELSGQIKQQTKMEKDKAFLQEVQKLLG